MVLRVYPLCRNGALLGLVMIMLAIMPLIFFLFLLFPGLQLSNDHTSNTVYVTAMRQSRRTLQENAIRITPISPCLP